MSRSHFGVRGGLEAPVAEVRDRFDVGRVEWQVEPQVLDYVVAGDDGGAVAAREGDGGRAGDEVEFGAEAVAVREDAGKETRRHARDLFAIRLREFVEHERPERESGLLRHAAGRNVEPSSTFNHLWVLDFVRRRPGVCLERAHLALES